MDRLRIIFVCPYYPWPPSIGGVENIVRAVSAELAHRGHDVHVVSSGLGVTPISKASGLGVEEKEGVTIHKLNASRLKVGYARFLWGLRRTVDDIKPDIVHSHNLHPHLFQLARWKADLQYKLVAELHHPAITLDGLGVKLLFPLAANCLKTKSNEIDAFIAHVRLERNWLVERGVRGGRIHELFFPGIPRKLLNYRSETADGHQVVFIGRIIRAKGLHVLIEAMRTVTSKVEDVSVMLVGPRDPGYFRFLTKLVLSTDLEKSVTFTGPLFGEEKYGVIGKSALFVLPSLREYTPTVIMEAQALGVPVVATRVGAVPEMMDDGKTGLLVSPDNPSELAEAMVTLLLDNDLRTNMAKQTKKFSEQFILESAVRKLEDLYYGLLS